MEVSRTRKATRYIAQVVLPRCLIALAISVYVSTSINAQQLGENFSSTRDLVPSLLPAPEAETRPFQMPSPPKHRRLSLNTLSVITLVAGEGIDSWGTYRNMTHEKWVCGNSPAFAGAYDTNAPGEISSLNDVMAACGAGPEGQSANWAFDVTRLGYFSEGGWVTQFHLANDRNFAAVEGWNLANDFGWYLLARHLENRKNWIGKMAPALNFGRGIVHLDLGIANLVEVKHNQNANTLDLHVPPDSNYTAPRWWGKR